VPLRAVAGLSNDNLARPAKKSRGPADMVIGMSPAYRIDRIAPADAFLSASNRFGITIKGPGSENGLSISVASEQEAAAVVAALSLAFEHGRLISDVPLQ